MRVTIACPATEISDGRHLAMVLGYGPADADTYVVPNQRDAGMNLYALASTLIFGKFVTNATTELQRPNWDLETLLIDMEAARRAQAKLLFIPDPYTEGVVTAARPDKIVALLLDDPQAAVALLGVSPIPVTDEAI